MSGWRRDPLDPRMPGVVFRKGQVAAVVSIDDGAWHLSVSCKYRYPRWRELHDARYQLVPDEATMAQILPPKAEYVNCHPNTFHLWQISGPKPTLEQTSKLYRRTA
jgi:hypothetical protein